MHLPPTQIIEEVLDFYPNKVKSNVFNRQERDDWHSIGFGSNYRGGIKKIPFFQNNAYLSKAGNTASAPEIIREVFNLFSKEIYVGGAMKQFTLASNLHKNDNHLLEKVAHVMRYVEMGIKKVAIKPVEFELADQIAQLNLPDEIKNKILEDNKHRYMFTHQGEDGTEVEFELAEESAGTQKIFSMIRLIIEAFTHRKVFIFDELDNQLHPHIADFIIKLFNDKTINKVGSQILFSRHNTLLMSPDKMRRDQVYFVDKKQGITTIFSLNDFDKTKVKTSTPYHNWYDEGRFGAIPVINFTKIKNILLTINEPNKAEIDSSIFGELD